MEYIKDELKGVTDLETGMAYDFSDAIESIRDYNVLLLRRALNLALGNIPLTSPPAPLAAPVPEPALQAFKGDLVTAL